MFEAVGKIFSNAMPWISAGMNLLSTVKSFEQAKDIEKQGRYNQEIYEQEALAVWRHYEDRATIMAHDQRLFEGAAVAAYGKSGVYMDGTPIEVLADIVYRQELDQVALYHEADAERRSRLSKGALAEWQAYQEGSSIRTQALANFGSSLLTSNLEYPFKWGAKDTAAATTAAGGTPAPALAGSSGRRYSVAAANQVPGARGSRYGVTT